MSKRGIKKKLRDQDEVSKRKILKACPLLRDVKTLRASHHRQDMSF